MEIDASPYTKDSKDGMTKGNIFLIVSRIKYIPTNLFCFKKFKLEIIAPAFMLK